MARNAAQSGVKAFEKADYQGAIELLSRAESLVHAPTHLLFIARAQAKLGLLVEAKESYLKVIREELSESSPRAFRDAQLQAQAEVEDIQSRIPRLLLTVPGINPDKVALTLDGQPFPNMGIGLETPINPGDHVLVAHADGYEDAEKSFQVQEAAKVSVELQLKEESPEATVSALDASVPPPAAGERPRGQGQRTAGWILGGAGLASLATGGVFGILTFAASSKAKKDEDLCPGGSCTSEGTSFVDGAKVKAMISNVTLGAGAALLTVGAVLVLTAPRSGGEVVYLAPTVAPGQAGLQVAGVFR